MAFKIGDKVRVITNKSAHYVAIGDVVEVLSFYDEKDPSAGYFVTGDLAVGDEELEPAE